MIPQKIHALFQFINFLDKNKETYINTYLPLIEELQILRIELNKLEPDQNYKDRIKYSEVMKVIRQKYEPINFDVYEPIIFMLQDLGIWSGDKEFTSIYNQNIGAVEELKKKFENEDVKTIQAQKEKYINFRAETNSDFLSLTIVFEELDELLKNLFDYFKDVQFNEFEKFESELIQVKSLADAVQELQKGNSKIVLPINFLINPELGTNNPEENKPVINKLEKFKNSIIYKNDEIIKKIHSELKGYFLNSEQELLNLLEGEQVLEKLYFPHNQNKLVEVFRRLKYNGFILSNDTEIKNWICSNFMFRKQKFEEPQSFNENSVWDILSKGKGEPTKEQRIYIEWLPYKNKIQLVREKESEKL